MSLKILIWRSPRNLDGEIQLKIKWIISVCNVLERYVLYGFYSVLKI